MNERKGGWIQTVTGKAFWPMDPRPEDVEIEDIAWALSNLCRFGGHTRQFYSVAQHSVLVSQHVRPDLALAALLHDATEAYLVDMPSPIKAFLPDYKAIEYTLAKCIGEKFKLQLAELDPEIKKADAEALATEARDLVGPAPRMWSPMPPPWQQKVYPWSQMTAWSTFRERARQLGMEIR